MEEALNPLGSYKLVPEKDPGMDIYPVQPELDFEKKLREDK